MELFSLETRQGIAHLKLSGDLRIDAADEILKKISSATSSTFVIDWEQAEHIHASVLQVLIALRKSLASQGEQMFVEKDNPQIREFLKVCGLSEYFQIHPEPAGN